MSAFVRTDAFDKPHFDKFFQVLGDIGTINSYNQSNFFLRCLRILRYCGKDLSLVFCNLFCIFFCILTNSFLHGHPYSAANFFN